MKEKLMHLKSHGARRDCTATERSASNSPDPTSQNRKNPQAGVLQLHGPSRIPSTEKPGVCNELRFS